jgi:YHS domain-containing protein/thiol-disulfide isomerase/thioredoxin
MRAALRAPVFTAANVALCLLLGACGASHAQGPAEVNWRTNVDTAKLEAAQSGRLLLLHFWTPSCGPCRVLESRVFNQPEVAEGLEQYFVPVKVNADQAPALASAFRIRSVPTDVLVTPHGNVVASLSCPNQPGPYLNQLENAAIHYERTAGAVASGNSPAALNAAYAGLDTGRYAATRQVPPTPVAASQPDANGPLAAPATSVATGPSPEAAVPSSPAPQVIHNPNLTASSSTTGAYPQTQTNPHVITPAAVPVKPPVAATPPQLPAGAAPLMFDGFCPVSLKFENKWVRGDVAIGMEHRGRTYLFATEAQRQKFAAAPDDYAPALNGIDPVLMLDENLAEAGTRRFGYRYQNRFYLFSSAESRARFGANPTAYATGVRQAMLRIDGTDSDVQRR